MRRGYLALAALLVALFGVFEWLGLSLPARWTTDLWDGGFVNGHVALTPFGPLTKADLYPLNPTGAEPLVPHFYLLGSDAGGRDLLALAARGAIPSLELVAIAVAARMLIGFVAGFGIAAGNDLVRGLARAAGGWVSSFPYLALAVLVIQAFTGGPSTVAAPGRTRLVAFVVAIAVIGWRDIAEVVGSRLEWVAAQPFAMGARAVGSTGFGYLRRHVWPYLRPALMVELSFQASAVLVLLAELGFLQYYLGGFTGLFENDTVLAYRLANQPELGQLLSDVRVYTQRQELAPALVPAVALVLAALIFEMIGRAFRGRADLP